MHPRPPKSAPGRIRSVRKTPAIKEIEEWVTGDNDMARETIRHASQLAENVTEERLLRSKLIDIGKERFKFLHKYTYERQAFMDKQKRKFSMFKKKRVNTTVPETPKPPKEPILTAKNNNKNVRVNTNKQSPYQRSLSAFARPKTVQFQGGYISTAAENSRPRTVPPNAGLNRVMITTIPENPELEAAETLSSAKQASDVTSGGMTSSTNLSSNTDAVSVTTVTESFKDLSRPSTAITMTTFGRLSSAESYRLARERRFSKYGSKFPGLTHEPRFSELEKSLSPNYISVVKPDVRRIIDKIESLRKPTLRSGTKEAKRELELKVKEFMAENGFSF